MSKRIILSGMRPTGRLHLGNLLGALSNWVKIQNEPETQCYYFVADWHALTTDYQDTGDIETNINEMVIDWIASGLDPAKSVLFRQSWIEAHAELALVLSMITPLSWLERNPTYKDQMNELKEKDISTHGFLGYPVLQAADITLYNATHVPVGEDQLPHLELTREIARRFNFLYKKQVLIEPQAILSQTPKVLGVDGRKMSKSYDNCIYIGEEESSFKKKIDSMFTDPLKIRANDPGHPRSCAENPTGCVCFSFHQVSESDESKVKAREEACKSGRLGCVQCKKELLEIMNKTLQPQREKRRELSKNKDKIREIIEDGTKKAKTVANETLESVREAINFTSA